MPLLRSGLALLLAVALLASCTNAPAKTDKFYVGVASAPINPEPGSFIAGDKQNRRFTGIHDSLFAKAVVISSGEEHLALVTLDCIGLLYPEVLRIREAAAQRCGIPASRIIVSSTHTHSGPDVVGIWGSDYGHSGVDSAYLDRLVQTAATQVATAWQNRRIATALVATTQFGEPWVENICGEEIDRTVSILQFKDKDGKVITTLTNFACHPTFMDASSSEVSADYVNGYYEYIREGTQAEGLFLQGAIGGWVQPEKEEHSFANALKRGHELGAAVMQAIPYGTVLTDTRLLFRSKTIRFPVENEAWKQLSAGGIIKRKITDSVETEIAWFSLGNLPFATHPGETAPWFGLETRKMMGAGPSFVLGLSNDALGYILKPSFFENKSIPHAEYLTSMSVGKPTGVILMKELRSIIPMSR